MSNDDYNEEVIKRLEQQVPKNIPEINFRLVNSGNTGTSFPVRASIANSDPTGFAFPVGSESQIKNNYKQLPVDNGTLEQKINNTKRQIEKDPILSNQVIVISKVERRFMFFTTLFLILVGISYFGYLGYTDHFKAVFTDNSTTNIQPPAVTVPVTSNNYNNITVPAPIANINNTVNIKICQVNGTIVSCP